MRTFEVLPRFARDFAKLPPPEQARRFRRVVLEEFVPGLRIKGVQAAPGVFELTWGAGRQGHLAVRRGEDRRFSARHFASHRHTRNLRSAPGP